MAKPNRKIEILDCTFRDGGYLNGWNFDRDVVSDTYRALSRAGVDIFEVGFRTGEKISGSVKSGIWRVSSDEEIRGITGPNEGAAISVMADLKQISEHDFCDKERSPVDLVRIAAHKDQMTEGLAMCHKIKEKGGVFQRV